MAIKKEQLEAITFANEIGAFDFNVKGRGGRTPLHYTVKKSHSEVFLLMLSLRHATNGLATVDVLLRDNAYCTAR